MATLREDLMDCITRFTDRKNETAEASGERGDYTSAMRDTEHAHAAQTLAVLFGSILSKHQQ